MSSVPELLGGKIQSNNGVSAATAEPAKHAKAATVDPNQPLTVWPI